VKPFRRGLLAAAALMAAPATAHAHLVNTRLGDFYGGMLHPLTGVEDAVPWLGLAILGALQGPERARWLLVVFPAGLAAGALLSLVAPATAMMPGLGVAVIAVTGLAVAMAIALPLPALLGVGMVVALLHGFQNGQAMNADTDRLLFISGLTATGYVFVTLATGLAITFLQGSGGWRLIAVRAAGSWVAAVGIMALGLALRAQALM
jgi:hydrogenase/urease accessory protein HupE